jgi:hypothetical protein
VIRLLLVTDPAELGIKSSVTDKGDTLAAIALIYYHLSGISCASVSVSLLGHHKIWANFLMRGVFAVLREVTTSSYSAGP